METSLLPLAARSREELHPAPRISPPSPKSSPHLNETPLPASISEQIGATFVINRTQKLPQEVDARLSQAARACKPDFPGQIVEIAAKEGDSIGEPRKTRIAADFAYRPQNPHGTQLFQDVGVAKDRAFHRCGLIF
jgi:hypothetical protein